MNPQNQALLFFLPNQSVRQLTPIEGGNVNDSCLVQLASGKRFILQKLSPTVFPDPTLVMANLQRVTEHLHRELQEQKNLSIQTTQLLQSPAGETSYVDQQGNHWRMLSYIDNSRTIPVLDSPVIAQEIGRMLGCFHQLLATLEPADLHDPLPGFHVTTAYLKHYDNLHRQETGPGNEQAKHCAALIERFRSRSDILERHRGQLRSGIIHGDPKVANFLFAQNSAAAISLIDLDTVMPGLLLHDLGDCLRSCCNPGGEEREHPAGISFDTEMFAAFLRGYYRQAMRLLTAKDQELLVDAAWLISFELGLRFFTDHLAGNRYFKVQHPEQNLHRARIQLQLARSIIEQRTTLERLQQQAMMDNTM